MSPHLWINEYMAECQYGLCCFWRCFYLRFVGGIFAVCWDIFAVCMDMTDCQYSALSRLTAFVFAVYQEHDRYLLVSQ